MLARIVNGQTIEHACDVEEHTIRCPTQYAQGAMCEQDEKIRWPQTSRVALEWIPAGSGEQQGPKKNLAMTFLCRH